MLAVETAAQLLGLVRHPLAAPAPAAAAAAAAAGPPADKVMERDSAAACPAVLPPAADPAAATPAATVTAAALLAAAARWHDGWVAGCSAGMGHLATAADAVAELLADWVMLMLLMHCSAARNHGTCAAWPYNAPGALAAAPQNAAHSLWHVFAYCSFVSNAVCLIGQQALVDMPGGGGNTVDEIKHALLLRPQSAE